MRRALGQVLHLASGRYRVDFSCRSRRTPAVCTCHQRPPHRSLVPRPVAAVSTAAMIAPAAWGSFLLSSVCSRLSSTRRSRRRTFKGRRLSRPWSGSSRARAPTPRREWLFPIFWGREIRVVR